MGDFAAVAHVSALIVVLVTLSQVNAWLGFFRKALRMIGHVFIRTYSSVNKAIVWGYAGTQHEWVQRCYLTTLYWGDVTCESPVSEYYTPPGDTVTVVHVRSI